MLNKYAEGLIQVFGNFSIKKKISILMIITVFISIAAIGYTSYRASESSIKESTLKATSILIELASNRLEADLSKIEEASVIILSNYDVQKAVKGEAIVSEQLRLKEKIYSIMNNYLTPHNGIDSIALYSFNDNMYLFGPTNEKHTEQRDFINFMENSSYDDLIAMKGKAMWLGINRNKDIVSLVRVVNTLGTWDKIGILCINVEASIFDSVSETLEKLSTGSFFLKDKNNTLICSKYTDDNLLEYSMGVNAGSENNQFVKINGTEYYEIITNFPGPDWNIDIYILSSEIFAASGVIKTSIFGTVILSIIITIIMVLTISDFITRPILKLRKIMYEVEKGDFSKRFDTKYKDEIGFLGNSFNSMIQQIKEYIEEIYNNYQRIKESEFEALQMKINPHFLYNNLNTINWMAQDIKADNIEVFSRALTNYFRLSLSKGNNIITIQEELDQLNNYIILQKVRYEDCISFVFDVDESLYTCKIVKLSLQPIVENAIFHGIEGRDGEGEIIIKGRMSDEIIVIEVTDNGIGMTVERLNELRESLVKQKTIGYGLRNVNERIKLYFGEYNGLEVDSEYNTGTKVRLTIPVKRGGE